MRAEEKLLKNSLIFTIANFGSKILIFLIIPYYTYVLTTSEYGIADTFISTISLIVPLITLYMQDSVMRFCMDKTNDSKSVLFIGLVILFAEFIILSLICPLLYVSNFYSNYIFYLFLIILFHSSYVIIGQYVRGIGKIKFFALGGVLFTLSLCISTPIFLGLFNLKVKGFLLSQAISYFISTFFYLFIIRNDIKRMKFLFNCKLFRKMLIYSLPLIPNAIMWWIMNLSDRYMILAMVGSSAVGVYSVANKIPSIISTFSNIFSQAFQISAIEESNSKDRSQFYSKVINNLFCLLLFLFSVIMFGIKPILNFVLSKSFRIASEYVPFLLASSICTALGTYYGAFYSSSKKTVGALLSTTFGAVFNVIFNLLLIPILKVNGAALATFIGMLLTFIYRAIDTQKFEKVTYNWNQIIPLIILGIIQTVLFYISMPMILYTLINGIILIIEFKIVGKIIYSVINKILIKFKRRKKII